MGSTMGAKSTVVLVSFLLVIVLLPPIAYGDQLRGSPSEDDGIVRSQQLFPLSSFLFSLLPSSISPFVELLSSLPTALITFIRSVALFIWDSILSLIFLISPIATTTMATSTTTAVQTTSMITGTTGMTGPTGATTTMAPSSTTSALATLMMTGTTGMRETTGATGMTTTAGMSTTIGTTSTSGTSTTMETSTAMETTTTMETSTTMETTTTMETSTTMETTTTTVPPPPSKTVFVTSQKFKGDFGGLEVGDAICAASAAAGNLSGTFLPWLSNSSHTPLNRFNQSSIPYVMTDGTPFADNFTSLVTSGPLNQLDVTEFTLKVVGSVPIVFTGTIANGSYSGFDCAGWSMTTNTGGGTLGFFSKSDEGWTEFVTKGRCDLDGSVYCMEQ